MYIQVPDFRNRKSLALREISIVFLFALVWNLGVLLRPPLLPVSGEWEQVAFIVEIFDQLPKLISVVDEMLHVIIFQIIASRR